MNARPHGARVVPTVATDVSTPRRVSGMPRHDQPVRRRAPVGMGQEPGHYVGHEDGAQREQHVLDSAEAALEDQHADGSRRDGDRHDSGSSPASTSMPAATPANSAQIVPTFATTSALSAICVRRCP